MPSRSRCATSGGRSRSCSSRRWSSRKFPGSEWRVECRFWMNTQYFAEFDTDRFIRERYFPDFGYLGTMIEVGGATPEFLSLSKHFNLNGWRTIVIEPNPKFVALHRDLGGEVYEYACSNE